MIVLNKKMWKGNGVCRAFRALIINNIFPMIIYSDFCFNRAEFQKYFPLMLTFKIEVMSCSLFLCISFTFPINHLPSDLMKGICQILGERERERDL